MEQIDPTSPRARARIAGAVYLLFFLTAVFGVLVPPGLSGPGGISSDAAATAKSIMANEASYELSVALGLISTAFYVALMALFYQLFRPVSRSISLVVAFFGLVGCAITAFASLFQLGPIVVLDGSSYLSVFDAKQLQAVALLFLHLNAQAGSIALVFFGVFQLLLGYVIFRSTFLPRILGVLIAVAGVGWLTFLAPPVSSFLLSELEVLGFVAEASLMLWLLVKGVNAERWNELARKGFLSTS